jgi:hypothetical protein
MATRTTTTTTAPPPAETQEGLPSTEPTTTEGGDAPVEPETPEIELSAYDKAVAFKPDPWDQLPEDPEVRAIYLGINGHINFFKRRA